mmetsp:Transcript_15603/g.37434  ORF Transcript_15603/g.37434 Transcript_15603/m.37434 type:complete len:213 (-) Transcript_15603:1014-1652(-)
MYSSVVNVHHTRAECPASVATQASGPESSAFQTRTVRSSEPDTTKSPHTSTQLTSSIWPSSLPSRIPGSHERSCVRRSPPPARARKANCPSLEVANEYIVLGWEQSRILHRSHAKTHCGCWKWAPREHPSGRSWVNELIPAAESALWSSLSRSACFPLSVIAAARLVASASRMRFALRPSSFKECLHSRRALASANTPRVSYLPPDSARCPT